MQLGAFRLRPFFAIRDTGYDSNVYRRQEDTKSDFTTTLSPGCDIFTYLGSRGFILLREQADFVVFAREDSQNHFNSKSLANINLSFNRFSIKTKGELHYLKERPNNEIDIRTRYTVSNFLLSSIYKHSSKTSADLSFSKKTIRYKSDDEFYESSLSDSLDRDEDAIILAFSQKILSKTTITLESEFTKYDFKNDFYNRDAEAEYYYLGFKFDPSAFISGDFKAGYASFIPKDRSLATYKGPIGNASLSYRITESTRMSLSYGKKIVFTIYQQNPFYKQNSYSLSIFQYLARRFGVELGGKFYKNRYTEPTNISVSIFDIRKDDIKTGYLEFKYKVNEQYNYGLRISRWKRESNVPNQNVEQTMIGLTVGYQF